MNKYRLIFLGFGILVVALVFEKSKRYGSIILALVVLSLLITVQRKGII